MPVSDRPLRGLDVLVVEDDPDSLDVLRQALEFFGARVAVALTADEARHRLHATPPHVIVTDIELGRDNGIELVEWLRAQPEARTNRVPAIAITGYHEHFEDRDAYGDVFADWLLQPLRPEALCAVILKATSVPDRHRDRRGA
ncbi:MAG: hypothetical protein AUH76_14845 [Candidatus Rokubacteria bacterium 13_1_40CM_4_67_11]|nr:MAG: hypothetical protein AUH76_14845 [Candidatus Rokubacteria bacterium 13_1_40CM_4_67_11]